MVKLFSKAVLVLNRSNCVFNTRKAFNSTFNYRKTVNENKQLARKLVLIENLSNQTNINYCSNDVYGTFLKEKFQINFEHFWIWSYRKRNFFLLQLNSLNDVEKLKSSCCFNLHALPVNSRMLETSIDLKNNEKTSKNIELAQNRKEIDCAKLKAKFSSEQLIEYFNDINSLSELDVKLRYFVISQLEEILCQGVFSGFQIYPFGSSLAGLGDSTSDLDLVLLHSNLCKNLSSKLNFAMPEIKSERDQIQLSLSLIADISRHYIPNFSNVNRILRARVPIVKTSFDLAPIDIDISIELSEQSGHHGFIMANYMSYCVQSKVVRQFLVFLKHWARQHGVVKTIPGNWFTNFQLVTIAIFFLQKKQILKSIESFDKDDQDTKSPNDSNFKKLLYEFFEFIVSFNFEKEAISILRAQSYSKPDFSPIFIENPIEIELNVCKNINGVEFKKLLLLAYNSMDAMHNANFHFADLLDPHYIKELEKQSSISN